MYDKLKYKKFIYKYNYINKVRFNNYNIIIYLFSILLLLIIIY